MDVPNYVDIVRAVKMELVAKGINVDASETSRAEITFRAADRIHAVDPRVGLLFKDSGNQVQERAVDILCFPDGTIVDILGAGPDGPNTPLWLVNLTKVDPGRWRAPFSYAEVPPMPGPTAPAPVPVTPQPVPAPTPLPPSTVPPVVEPPSPVPSALSNALSALGAWLGTQAVNAVLAWWSNRKKTPPSTGTVGRAVPRPVPPTRTTLPK